ncbi:hypothetical protein MMC30_004214 [Trapelia coarctata]|nr:hypothetical protein [Trapelia coarctata]
MRSFLRPGRNGTTTPTSAPDEVPSLTEDLGHSPARLPVTSGPAGRLSQEQPPSESPETGSRNMSLTINGAGTWASPPHDPGSRNGVGSPSLVVEQPEAQNEQLVDGVSSNSESSQDVLAPLERPRQPAVNDSQTQTPAQTDPTPGTNTPLPSLPASTPAQSHRGYPAESIQTRTNGRSTVIDPQMDQPPETPGRNRRRRRFVRWISSRFQHHGPWVPGMQRNRNIVSNAIANVDRLFRRSS